MSADGVVEHLDVAEDIAARFLSCAVGFSANALTFKQLEETLRYSIVVAVSSPAHAGLQVVAGQEALPFVAGELATLIGMHNNHTAGSSAPYSHMQRIQRKLCINATARGPTHDLPRVQINHGSQVQPAFVCCDVRDVGHPSHIGFTHCKLLFKQVRCHDGSGTTSWTWSFAIASLGFEALVAQQLGNPMPATALAQVTHIQ